MVATRIQGGELQQPIQVDWRVRADRQLPGVELCARRPHARAGADAAAEPLRIPTVGILQP